MVKMKLSEELKWRGFFNQTTLKDLSTLDSKKYYFYHGFDASSDSLTIGNLAAVMMDKCLIRHGQTAFIIAGGATSLIGDPGGKDSERSLQSEDVVRSNVSSVQKQLANLLGKRVTFLNNLDWLSKINVIEFLRDVGKYFSMTPLIQRDYIAKRIGPGGSGISYTELSYTLLQGYDFFHLNQKYGVDMQVAGSDQWGNCLSGVELIKRVSNKTVDVLTCPLIINQTTGKKFGKSESGAVWLDPNKTSPLDFYQFWINCDDKGVISYLKIFTELDKDQIDAIEDKHLKKPSDRIGQKTLAYEVTKLVHGQKIAEEVKLATEILVGNITLEKLASRKLGNLKDHLNYARSKLPIDLVDILVKTNLTSSATEANRLITNNSIYINGKSFNKNKIDIDFKYEKFLLIRRGKALKDSLILEIKK